MQKLKALFVVCSTGLATSAFAAVPTEVTDAIDGAGTDAAVIGGAVLVVLIGIAAFKFMRRAM